MKINIKNIFLGGVAAMSVFVAACGNEEVNESTESGTSEETSTEETIKIGTIWEQSGGGSAYGLSQLNAQRMAVDEINENGGVLGRQLEIVDIDTQTDNAEAALAATAHATENNVVAIFGPSFAGAFQAAQPIAEQYEVPLISSSVTVNNVNVQADESIFEYSWRTSTSNDVQSAALVKYVEESLGAKKAVILADNSTDYGKGWTEEIQNAMSDEPVAIENYTGGQTDFSATLTKIQGMDFDVLYVPGYLEEQGPIVRQAREMGITQPIAGSNGFGNPTIYELAGAENMVDIYYPTEFFIEGEDEETVAFRDKYTSQYDNEPDMFAGLAYDNVYILAEAIERAGSAEPKAVNIELANTQNFEGITGAISFDEKHDAIKSTSIVEIQDGKPVGVHAVEVN